MQLHDFTVPSSVATVLSTAHSVSLDVLTQSYSACIYHSYSIWVLLQNHSPVTVVSSMINGQSVGKTFCEGKVTDGRHLSFLWRARKARHQGIKWNFPRSLSFKLIWQNLFVQMNAFLKERSNQQWLSAVYIFYHCWRGDLNGIAEASPALDVFLLGTGNAVYYTLELRQATSNKEKTVKITCK